MYTNKPKLKFIKKLDIWKNGLRDLSFFAIQDPWDRELLMLLRKKHIASYYANQLDLEKIASLNQSSPERQKLYERVQNRILSIRSEIVDTTQKLGIRPQEVPAEEDALMRIFGIVKNT